MENLKFSYIIPVFNMEKYIEKCLDSVINQKYKNIEIIIVNDGSTDGSLNIINEYLKKDNRITLINKENGGIGSAYEAALKIAQGDYILFVDSDDYCDLDECYILSEALKKEKHDIVHFGIKFVDADGNESERVCFDNKLILGNEDVINYHFTTMMHPSLARKAYKREMFDNCKLLSQNIGIDELLTAEILMNCSSMLIIPDVLYTVFNRAGSISRTKYKDSSIIQSMLVFEKIIELSKDKNVNVYSEYLYKHLGLFITISKQFLTVNEYDKIYELLKKWEYKKKLSEFKKTQFYKNLPFEQKLRKWIFGVNPIIYLKTRKLLKKEDE